MDDDIEIIEICIPTPAPIVVEVSTLVSVTHSTDLLQRMLIV